jgi:hypothetical protein
MYLLPQLGPGLSTEDDSLNRSATASCSSMKRLSHPCVGSESSAVGPPLLLMCRRAKVIFSCQAGSAYSVYLLALSYKGRQVTYIPHAKSQTSSQNQISLFRLTSPYPQETHSFSITLDSPHSHFLSLFRRGFRILMACLKAVCA